MSTVSGRSVYARNRSSTAARRAGAAIRSHAAAPGGKAATHAMRIPTLAPDESRSSGSAVPGLSLRLGEAGHRLIREGARLSSCSHDLTAERLVCLGYERLSFSAMRRPAPSRPAAQSSAMAHGAPPDECSFCLGAALRLRRTRRSRSLEATAAVGASSRQPRRLGAARSRARRLVECFPADLTDVGERVAASPRLPFVLSQAATELVRHARPPWLSDEATPMVSCGLGASGTPPRSRHCAAKYAPTPPLHVSLLCQEIDVLMA
jgi:hypothetical protein